MQENLYMENTGQKFHIQDKSRIPYLDGIRAYSIFVVLMGHASGRMNWINSASMLPVRTILCCGGLGVKIFFVLSGFLITTLLLNEQEVNGKISISGFYARRAARIFPAFYAYFLFVLLGVILGLHAIVDPGSILAAATYTWNYGFLWTHPAGDAGGIFGHLWTLALEEQFYLLWPACLVLLGKNKAKNLAIALLVWMPLARLLTDVLFPSLRGHEVMMFQSGADQILWGAVVAFVARGPFMGWLRNWRYRSAVPWGCCAVVYGLCPYLINLSKGIGSVVCVSLQCASAAIFFLWLLTGQGGWLRRVLESPWVIRLGVLSYSLYIWQQVFLLWGGLPQVPLVVRLLVLTVLALTCYYFVEVPMRRWIRKIFHQGQVNSMLKV